MLVLCKEQNIVKSIQRAKKSQNEIPIPKNFEKLKEAIKNTPDNIPHLPDAGIRTFLIPCGLPNEPDIILFANPEYVAKFKDATFWCIDGTFSTVPFVEGLKQLVTIMARKDGQVIPFLFLSMLLLMLQSL